MPIVIILAGGDIGSRDPTDDQMSNQSQQQQVTGAERFAIGPPDPRLKYVDADQTADR